MIFTLHGESKEMYEVVETELPIHEVKSHWIKFYKDLNATSFEDYCTDNKLPIKILITETVHLTKN